ncbi:MAG: tRNA uracil 4-sulfurtransferase ThiI, partial [Tissierellia bacterium]|nr:tRNA uracil 4-sulfurtransferase ThiI [Tissierellia bacterium]
EKNLESIEKAISKLIAENNLDKENYTFKVHTTRGDKAFEYKSPEINMKMGGYVLKNYPNLKVDVHNPDHYIYIDIKQNAYVYTKKIKAQGGMPPGTNGSAILMLSGGIDSPVAGYMMAKRGIELKAVYFHSYPFTSERAEKKVENLASILARYAGEIKLYSINVLEIQKAINEYCPEREGTIHLRRFMIRLSERICNMERADALITGENLGQVASQTIDALKVTDSTTDKLIFRPLIGMDKQEIIDIAKDIESYEESIKPYEDCCTVFLPKHPVLKPEIKKIEESESKLEIETLIENAMKTATVKIIK